VGGNDESDEHLCLAECCDHGRQMESSVATIVRLRPAGCPPRPHGCHSS
jgi:hypothetical protein